MTSFFVSVTHLKGTHYNVHPAPSSVCLSICLVFCSVTQPIPRGIILSREQLCSRWAKHVGCTRSNTQHRAGFSGAYALWVQVQQISGWELDKPASLALFPPNTTIPPPPPGNKHTQSNPSTVQLNRCHELCVHTIISYSSDKRKLWKTKVNNHFRSSCYSTSSYASATWLVTAALTNPSQLRAVLEKDDFCTNNG